MHEGTSVGTCVGSAAAILLLAIMIVAIIASIVSVESQGNDAIVQCQKFTLAGYYDVVIYSTANIEDPYYSKVVYEELLHCEHSTTRCN